MRTCKLLIIAMAIGGFSEGTQVFAQSNNTWNEQGPGPILNDSNTVLPPNSPVAGAINAIVPSPTSADVVFVGTVSGGVWKTSNATAAAPTWIPLTDNQLPQLPIKSLAMSPGNSDVLFAGTGSTSSFGPVPPGSPFDGSGGIGVARSTDGGNSWTVLASDTFTGRVITSIVPTTLNKGATMLTATWPDQGGVYMSTDNGITFTRISGNGKSGLPNAGVTSLIADPSNANRFYAGVPGAAPEGAPPGAGAAAGVYRSDDGGVTWNRTGLQGLSMSLRILLTVHNDAVNNVVYADVITNGVLSGVFRSTNQGSSWRNLGRPNPPIYSAGDTEGGQGGIHGAIAADPSNPNVVFISGDSQSLFPPPPPNANGCNSFSGNVFRYTGTAWENVVCNGANGTSPHADSRFMTFDANGNLLQANDGGIVRLVRPNTPTMRRWVAADGNIKSAEFHSIAYDPLSNIIFGGTQDNGTPYQLSLNNFSWNQLSTGDGGVVGVDANQRAHAGTSIRYSSFQNLGSFNRSVWNTSNAMVGMQPVRLVITNQPGMGMTLTQFEGCNLSPPACPFYPAFALNAIDPTRMLIESNNIYESVTQGDTLMNLRPTGANVLFYGRPIVYGGSLNGLPMAGVFYVGAGTQIYQRVTAGGPITTLNSPGGDDVVTIAMNPKDYRQVYVCDTNNKVWGSSNEGVNWVDLTGDLGAATGLVTTIEVFSPDATVGNTTLYAGGFGVFQLTNLSSGHWTPVTGPAKSGGSKIPPAVVADLHYDYDKNVLVAGTLGRGAWLFGPATVSATASSQMPKTSSLSVATAAQNQPPVAPVRAKVPGTP